MLKITWEKEVIYFFFYLINLIYSCSKSIRRHYIDLVQPEPVIPVVKYQLSVTVGEGGSVSTTEEFTKVHQ